MPIESNATPESENHQEFSGPESEAAEALRSPFSEAFKQQIQNAVVVESSLSDEDKEGLKTILLRSRENTRSTLARRLIHLLGITVAFIQVSSLLILALPEPENSKLESGEILDRRFSYSKDVASVLLSTQTGLVGAVIGFYFGSKESN